MIRRKCVADMSGPKRKDKKSKENIKRREKIKNSGEWALPGASPL